MTFRYFKLKYLNTVLRHMLFPCVQTVPSLSVPFCLSTSVQWIHQWAAVCWRNDWLWEQEYNAQYPFSHINQALPGPFLVFITHDDVFLIG